MGLPLEWYVQYKSLHIYMFGLPRAAGENQVKKSIVTCNAFCAWGRHRYLLECTLSGSSMTSWTAPSHYLNQYWNIVNWNLGNKFQWNLNRNSNIFIHENAIESVVCEMAAIMSRPQWVNSMWKPQDDTVSQSILLALKSPATHTVVWGTSALAWFTWSNALDRSPKVLRSPTALVVSAVYFLDEYF